MVLATSVFMIKNKLQKMAASNVICFQRKSQPLSASPGGPLSLTQVFLKLLPLHWKSEHVEYCVHL